MIDKILNDLNASMSKEDKELNRKFQKEHENDYIYEDDQPDYSKLLDEAVKTGDKSILKRALHMMYSTYKEFRASHLRSEAERKRRIASGELVERPAGPKFSGDIPRMAIRPLSEIHYFLIPKGGLKPIDSASLIGSIGKSDNKWDSLSPDSNPDAPVVSLNVDPDKQPEE